MSARALYDRLRQPEYTGENRCLPCTAVNVGLAALAGAVVGLVSVGAGLVAFLAALGLIYLRGYLVPGTPRLTKRHLPDRVLAAFDKRDDPVAETVREPGPEDVDPERLLSDLGAVEPCEHEDDLCLTEGFAAAWRDRVETIGRPVSERRVADLLSRDPESVEVRDGVVYVDRRRVRHWPSGGALIADLAADDELSSRAEVWGSIDGEQRLGILAALRMFLDRCPLCSGAVETGEETVESCCRSWEVVAVSCADCGARYLEIDPDRV